MHADEIVDLRAEAEIQAEDPESHGVLPDDAHHAALAADAEPEARARIDARRGDRGASVADVSNVHAVT